MYQVYTSSYVDDVYYIKEDGLFIVRDSKGDDIKSFEVKSGDIIYKMYSCTNEYKDKVYIKITDPALLDYYKAARKRQEEKIKKWQPMKWLKIAYQQVVHINHSIMEKIIVSNQGDILAFNTETNAMREKANGLYSDSMIKAEEDAQVITKEEVININKGEWVIVLRTWTGKGAKIKVIVMSDPATIHDLDEWKKEMDALKNITNEIG